MRGRLISANTKKYPIIRMFKEKYLAERYTSTKLKNPTVSATNRKGSFLKLLRATEYILITLLIGIVINRIRANSTGKNLFPKSNLKYCSPPIKIVAAVIPKKATRVDLFIFF